MHDELTKILNRRGFYDQFQKLFDEAKSRLSREEGRRTQFRVEDVAVLFIDADNFKYINDTYGHDAGDEVLRQIASVCQREVRGVDIVSRFGGEEFVVGLVGAHEDAAYRKAEQIRSAIGEDVQVAKDKSHTITGSVGVAALRECRSETVDELIDYADKAMYEAKRNRGKNNTVRCSEITC